MTESWPPRTSAADVAEIARAAADNLAMLLDPNRCDHVRNSLEALEAAEPGIHRTILVRMTRETLALLIELRAALTVAGTVGADLRETMRELQPQPIRTRITPARWQP